MIRRATIQDYDDIMAMMINFANSSPYVPFFDPQYNDKTVRLFLDSLLKSGVILLAERENKCVGMLLGQIQQDPWLPHVKTMKEIAWWVEPEHRETTIGYRLLTEYVKCGKKLQQAGIINGFTLTSMEISPIGNLEKRGWTKIETNYLYEGA